MKLYQIPWFDKKCYFIPAYIDTEVNDIYRGYHIDYQCNPPEVRRAAYTTADIAKMELVSKDDTSCQKIMSNALIDAMLTLSGRYAHEEAHNDT